MSNSFDTQAAAAFVPPSAGLLPRRRSTLTTRKEEVKIPSQDSIDLFSTETSSVLKFGVQFNHTGNHSPRELQGKITRNCFTFRFTRYDRVNFHRSGIWPKRHVCLLTIATPTGISLASRTRQFFTVADLRATGDPVAADTTATDVEAAIASARQRAGVEHGAARTGKVRTRRARQRIPIAGFKALANVIAAGLAQACDVATLRITIEGPAVEAKRRARPGAQQRTFAELRPRGLALFVTRNFAVATDRVANIVL
jgi:hypothetical protein